MDSENFIPVFWVSVWVGCAIWTYVLCIRVWFDEYGETRGHAGWWMAPFGPLGLFVIGMWWSFPRLDAWADRRFPYKPKPAKPAKPKRPERRSDLLLLGRGRSGGCAHTGLIGVGGRAWRCDACGGPITPTTKACDG